MLSYDTFGSLTTVYPSQPSTKICTMRWEAAIFKRLKLCGIGRIRQRWWGSTCSRRKDGDSCGCEVAADHTLAESVTLKDLLEQARVTVCIGCCRA